MKGPRARDRVEVLAKGLGKFYAGRPVVQDVSFSAPAGEVTVLIGGNGAGKSTTLRLMLGLARGTGVTTFGGAPLADHKPVHRTVGVFLGSPAFHLGRSARDHLRCLAAASGASDGRVAEVLDMVGLTDVAHSPVRTFSTGMRQRLGLAAALLDDPPVLVLDEPINGLDPQSVMALRYQLAEHAARGGTVIMATHVLGEVEALASRAVVMAAGQVKLEGTVRELLDSVQGSVPELHVRTDEAAVLTPALEHAGATVFASGLQELTVSGLPARVVAETAVRHGVLVWGLSSRRVTLEDLYMHASSSGAATPEESRVVAS